MHELLYLGRVFAFCVMEGEVRTVLGARTSEERKFWIEQLKQHGAR